MQNKKPLEKLINTYDKKPRTPLKIGVCLSGGAIRGLAHVGVLRVLYNEFIPIDLIAGSSAGSVVAGLYALYGYHSSWAVFERTLKRNSIFRIKKNKDDELFDSAYFKRWLKELFGNATFNDVKIPLEVTALDIISGKTIYLSEGYLRDAIYASCAVPGVWKPAKIGNMLLVDGSFGDDVPVEWLRSKGADVIIVSIVNFYNEFLYGTGLSLSRILKFISSSGILNPFIITGGIGLEYLTRDIDKKDLTPLKTLLRALAIFAKNLNKQKWGSDADVKIVPDIGDFYSSNPGYLSTSKRSEFISAGAIATWKKIPQLKYLLGEIKLKKELSESASDKIKKRIKSVGSSFLKLVG
ncbi:MAG: patatin-like phospholipase family protein [bacterium]